MNESPEFQWLMREPSDKPSMRLATDGPLQETPTADQQDVAGDETACEGEPAMAGLRIERRDSRRFDVEAWDVSLDRCDDRSDASRPLGKMLDLSAGGVRVRTRHADVRQGQQIRVRLALPDVGGIRPFVDLRSGQAKPTREWTGWLDVRRVRQVGTAFEVAGRLVDMEAMDRGMLGLYLSAQPMAA